MLFLAKLSAGTLLTLSLALMAAAIMQLMNPAIQGKDRDGAAYALIFLGAISGLSVWVFKGAGNLQDKKKQDKLLACFYEHIQNGKGRITQLSFAAKAGIDGREAKDFLEARASEYNGGYEVDSDGNMVYVFPSL